MSTGGAATATSTDENGSRRSRRGTVGREREMEEVSPAPTLSQSKLFRPEDLTHFVQLMIEEAMRLSLIDHEDHQKKMHDQVRGGNAGGSGSATPNSVNTNEASSSHIILPGPSSSTGQKEKGKASKFLSSFKQSRSRANSAASNKSVSFSSQPMPSRNSGSSSPTSNSPITSKSPPTTSNLKPASPVAPVTTLADHRSIEGDVSAEASSSAPVGSIPRISMDMAPMEPTPAKTGPTHVENDMPVPPTYARLNSEA